MSQNYIFIYIFIKKNYIEYNFHACQVITLVWTGPPTNVSQRANVRLRLVHDNPKCQQVDLSQEVHKGTCQKLIASYRA